MGRLHRRETEDRWIRWDNGKESSDELGAEL